MDDPNSPSLRVVEALARWEGVDVTELYPPLYRAVDPEALDAFLGMGATSTAEFEYEGIRVRVDSAGRVRLDEVPAVVADGGEDKS